MNIFDLRKKRAETKAAAKAIVQAAMGEGRDIDALTDEEVSKLKAFNTEAEQLDQKIAAAEDRRSATEWIEVVDPDQPEKAKAPTLNIPRTDKIKVPDAARRLVKPLRAFKGETAIEDAYVSGRWAHAVLFGSSQSANWCREHGIDISAALQEGVNTAGGYLVVPQFEQTIIDLREQWGVARRLCKRHPMSGDTLSVPIKSSGLTAYYVAEGATGTATQAGGRQAQLVAKTIQTETAYSNELSEDAFVSIADDIAMDAAKALSYFEDNAWINGDGTSTYANIYGIKNKIADGTHSASIVTATSGNTSFATLDLADFEAVVGAYPQFPGAAPVWVISKAGWAASMLRLQNAAGGTTGFDIGGSYPAQFLGFPVIWTASGIANSSLSAQTDATIMCYFGDFNLSTAFGDRRGMTMTSDPYSRMKYRETTVYTTERFDINHHSLGTTSAAGPVLALVSNN